jgi:hypothetical protein
MLWLQCHLPSPAFEHLFGLFLSFLLLASSGKQGQMGFPTVYSENVLYAGKPQLFHAEWCAEERMTFQKGT